MTAKETIESLQLLIEHIDFSVGEDTKKTLIHDVKPSSTIFVLCEAIDCIKDYVIGYHFKEGE